MPELENSLSRGREGGAAARTTQPPCGRRLLASSPMKGLKPERPTGLKPTCSRGNHRTGSEQA